MLPLPRPALLGLPACPHGGNALAGELDFSTGVSPLAPPPSVLEAYRGADLTRYPHPTGLPLREALAELHGVSGAEVVVGNGSVELIWALARAYGGEGREALVLTPAFGEYLQALRVSGCGVRTLEAKPPSFEWSPDALRAELHRAPALVFLCRPSNPCLSSLPLETLEALAGELPGVLFVVDEAYQPLFEDAAPMRPRRNVVVLRSLTKVFALPGLRLGYLLGEPALLRPVQASLPPWNVSAPALAAGRQAAFEFGHVPAVREEISRLRLALHGRLVALGVSVEAAGGPFLLCRVPEAQAFAAALAQAGVRVRDCSSFGLPQHVRVGVRPLAEHDLLITAWQRALETNG